MANKETYQRAQSLIEASHNILITTHTKPDGDACGCMLALHEALTARGKRAVLLLLSNLPSWYRFLFASMPPVLGEDLTVEELNAGRLVQPDLIIVVDTNSYSQLPRFENYLRQTDTPVLVIDHHATADGLGAVEITDPTAAAAGLVLLDFLNYAGWPITRTMSEFLFVAIATDTGWFRFTNANSPVFRACARLTELGADPSSAYRSLYQGFSYKRFQLMLRMLNSLQLQFDGRYACQQLTREDFEQTGTSYKDTEKLIDECKRISTVQIAALFVELESGDIRCSMRSRGDAEVAKIMQQFGGGGHAMAAAATLAGPIGDARRRIQSEVEKQLGRSSQSQYR